MSEANEIVAAETTEPAQEPADDLVVIASNPAELYTSHGEVLANVKQKLRVAVAEAQSAIDMVEEVMKANIKPDAAKTALRRAEHRVLYLSKVAAALEAGYVMVPNFPGEAVAIRVKRQGTRAPSRISSWKGDASRVADERPDYLPAGEGRYVSPSQTVSVQVNEFKEGTNEPKTWLGMPMELIEEISLPIEFIKPTVVQRTGKVMMRKIFDEIAVAHAPMAAPGTGGRGDPMVLGRIIDPARRRMLSFLVAWFVDTRTI